MDWTEYDKEMSAIIKRYQTARRAINNKYRAIESGIHTRYNKEMREMNEHWEAELDEQREAHHRDRLELRARLEVREVGESNDTPNA